MKTCRLWKIAKIWFFHQELAPKRYYWNIFAIFVRAISFVTNSSKIAKLANQLEILTRTQEICEILPFSANMYVIRIPLFIVHWFCKLFWHYLIKIFRGTEIYAMFYYAQSVFVWFQQFKVAKLSSVSNLLCFNWLEFYVIFA